MELKINERTIVQVIQRNDRHAWFMFLTIGERWKFDGDCSIVETECLCTNHC